MIAIGQEATMTAVFKNPLPVKMSDITLNIESDELLSGISAGLSTDTIVHACIHVLVCACH